MGLTKISYSLPNLKSLLNSSNSCIYCIEKCSRSLTLLPVHLDNIKHSVNELLAAKAATFDTVLKGIILGHKNIKVINHVQLNDDGNFGLDYVADIYIFKPENGNLLSGEVNKKGKDHIGVLVHSFFNATIHRPRIDSECPRNWVGFDVNIGQSVTLEVVKSNLTGRLPFITGKLVNIKEYDNEDGDSGIGGHESTEENSSVKDVSSSVNEGESKKKKKKKSLVLKEDLNTESSVQLKKNKSVQLACQKDIIKKNKDYDSSVDFEHEDDLLIGSCVDAVKKKKKKSVNLDCEKNLSSVDTIKKKKEHDSSADFECEKDLKIESCLDAVKKKKKKSSVDFEHEDDLLIGSCVDAVKKKKKKSVNLDCEKNLSSVDTIKKKKEHDSSADFECEKDLKIESCLDAVKKKKKKSSVELKHTEDLETYSILDVVTKKKKKKRKSKALGGCEEDLQMESSVDALKKTNEEVSHVEVVCCEEDLKDLVIGDKIKRKKKKSIKKDPSEENIQLESHGESKPKKKKLSIEHEKNSQTDASGNKGKTKKRSFQDVDYEENLKIQHSKDKCKESSRTDLIRPKKRRKLSTLESTESF